MRSRADTDVYNASVDTMLNMVPDAHGPAVSRAGMKWLVRVLGSIDGRVYIFEINKDEFWILVFDGTKMYSFSSSGVANPVASTTVPWAVGDLKDLHFIPDPNGVLITIVHPSFLPWEVAYAPGTANISVAVSAYTATPAAWATDKYPSAGCIYGGRLYLAFGTTIWATRNDDRQNLTQGVNAIDGFEVTRDQYGAISWMEGTKDLLMGTISGEYAITSQTNTVSIVDISIDKQSSYGSKNIQAKQLGDKMAYITLDGLKLHAMQNNRDSLSWLSDDLTFMSEHITSGGIKDFVWQRHPHTIAWFTDLVGDFLCITYNRAIDIFGWGRHNTQGTVLSLASGTLGGTTKVVVLATRNGSDLDVEIMDLSQQMDSYISVAVVGPTDIVTGLAHLNGQTVKVMVDGAVHPDKTVSGGQITLQKEYTGVTVVVGLGYTQRLKTLPLDKGSNKGSGRAYQKKWKDIFVDLISSGLPLINGELPADRDPSVAMDSPPELITGEVKVNDLDYDRPAIVEIIQNNPLPLKISAIYGEISQDKI